MADDPPVSVLVVGADAEATARRLRSPAVDARAVRRADQAATLLGLSGSDCDLVLLAAAPTGRPHLADEIRKLRESSRDTLLFVLVGAATESAIVELLDLGADDYVVDPVAPAVLAARVRARRRRRSTESRSPRRGPLGDLVIDRSARRSFVRDQEVVLRAKEFDLLDTLATNAGRVVTRTTLMSVVWDEHWFRSTKTLDVTMVGLRRRLREAADLAEAVVPEISTIRGVGYRLDPADRRQPSVAYTVRSHPR